MSTSLAVTATQQTLDSETRTANGVIIGPIPLLLYQEISREYGLGEETTGPNYGNGFWKRRRLNPEHGAVGFAGTIGIRKQFEDFYFTLWSRTFENVTSGEELDYYSRQSEVVVISSATLRTGVWAYGKGDQMAESNTCSFRIREFRLVDQSVARAIQFAAAAVDWASQKAIVAQPYMESFWEADKNPNGDYEEPSS